MEMELDIYGVKGYGGRSGGVRGCVGGALRGCGR